MDLFGPSRTRSIEGNYYALVLVDDYSRYTCTFFIPVKNDTFFIPTKNDTFKIFEKFSNFIQNEKDLRIKSIRSDHGVNFKMLFLKHFVKKMGFHTTFQHQNTTTKWWCRKEKYIFGRIGEDHVK